MNQQFPDFEARCRRAQEALQRAGIDYLLVGPSADLFYLIGLNRPQSERLTLLVLPAAGDIRLILPSFERALAEPLASFFVLDPWEETEDPTARVRSCLPDSGRGQRIGVADKLFVHFLYRLQAAVPGSDFVSGGRILEQVRMHKEPYEIDQMGRAGAAADRVFAELLRQPLAGTSEADLKARIMGMLTEFGHDTAGGAIVGAGSNGASPHHHVGPRELSAGDAVVIDFGGSVGGYWSDMTRTLHIGEPGAKFRKVYDVVRDANQKAFEHVRPGVTAESIDHIARGVIAEAGYGAYFLHRTGHGIGLEIHEPPYLVGGSQTIIEEGMTFSIEPGIYIRGEFGIRIEDIVAVTRQGAQRFNQSSHALQVVEP